MASFDGSEIQRIPSTFEEEVIFKFCLQFLIKNFLIYKSLSFLISHYLKKSMMYHDVPGIIIKRG